MCFTGTSKNGLKLDRRTNKKSVLLHLDPPLSLSHQVRHYNENIRRMLLTQEATQPLAQSVVWTTVALYWPAYQQQATAADKEHCYTPGLQPA